MHTLTILDTAPETIRVKIDYYNKKHGDLLKQPPYPESIKEMVGTTIEVPTADLLAYYLFHKQRQRPDLYSSLTDVRELRLNELGELNNIITFKGGSIHAEAELEDGDTSITGRLGEAVALAVMGKLYPMHSGDWLALPEKVDKLPKMSEAEGWTYLKPMDYKGVIGSSGKHVIQVEAKGSYLYNPGELGTKPQKVLNHASNIAAKKKSYNTLDHALDDFWRFDVSYGTITTFGKEGDAHCYLLDPPENGPGEGQRFKTISRLLHYSHLLQNIAPRSQLTVAIINRVVALVKSTDIMAFNKSPLLKANGKPFYQAPEHWSNNLLPNKSYVMRHAGIKGKLFYEWKQPVYFAGLQRDIVNLLAEQDFDGICEYKSPTSMTKTSVYSNLSDSEVQKLNAHYNSELSAQNFKRMNTRLFHCSDGFSFGVVKPSNGEFDDKNESSYE